MRETEREGETGRQRRDRRLPSGQRDRIVIILEDLVLAEMNGEVEDEEGETHDAQLDQKGDLQEHAVRREHQQETEHVVLKQHSHI